MVNFNFSFDPGTSLQQMVGFETAGRIWSSYLTDPITVNLQVGVSSSLSSNVIGGALPGMSAKQSYQSFTIALKADATSTDDQTALKQVSGSRFSATYEGTLLGINYKATGTSSSLNLTRAEAKALGLSVSGGLNGLDGYILFGSLTGAPVQWDYDYTRSAPAPANSLDFLSTALHEIGHVLGFVSSLDSPGWLNTNYGTNVSAAQAVFAQLNAITTGATALDLFRYDTNASNLSNTRNLSLGGNKVFALGSGSTSIANFSTGVDTTQGGNGQQASHWLTGTSAIEAPTLTTGTRSAIANTDLRALDVIGWNVAPNGINTAIDLSALQAQSKQSLATRLGQTVSWLDANSTTAAQSLVQDRSQDIYTMAVQSQIYDLTRVTPPTPGIKGNNQTGDNQTDIQNLTYNQLFQEQGLFETTDELQVLPAVTVQPSLESLVWGVESNLTRITPPTPGLPLTSHLELLSPNLTRITPPTPGIPPTPPLPSPKSLSQSVQPLTTGATTAPTSDHVLTGNADYYYGNSELVTYPGTDQSTQQAFAPLTVLVDLSAAL